MIANAASLCVSRGSAVSPPAYDSNRGQSWNVRGDAGSHFPKLGAVWSEKEWSGCELWESH